MRQETGRNKKIWLYRLGIALLFALLTVLFWLNASGGSNPLMNAIANRDLPAVKKILKENPQLINERVMSRTALHLAAATNSRFVKLITARGADLDVRDELGNTPLHIAAHNMRGTAVNILLEAGSDPNARDRDGNTPLHHLAYGSFYAAHGNKNIARALLSKGAKLDAVNQRGQTPLDVAMINGNHWIADYLIELSSRQKVGGHEPEGAVGP